MKTFYLACLVAAAPLFAQNVNDQQFVNQAAQINMTEAHIGQVAQQKGATDAVKQYGQKLESDHKDSYQKLTAAANGLNVPNGIDAQHQSQIKTLDNYAGMQFDQHFKQMMIQGHQKAIDLFQRASTSLQSQQLRDYASETLPVLKEHLQIAQNLGDQTTSLNTTPLAAPNAETASPQPVNTATTAQSADRSRNSSAPADTGQANTPMAANTTTRHGTVISYQPGQKLDVKIRDRVGHHVYDLGDNQVAANVASDLRAGSQVVIVESVDQNGRRSIDVRPE